MIDWPLPTSLKSLRGFLGLTRYYRKFIKGYGSIATPLTAFLKKNAFRWTSTATEAFQNLKAAVTEPPVLALPDFSNPFVLECDASGLGIGAVLMQGGKLIAYFSQALKGKNAAMSTYEKELLVVVLAVHKWHPYLIGQSFIVRTKQQSLKHLLEQKIGTPFQQKWLTKLLGYDFKVEYKRGKENKVVDALSRKEEVVPSGYDKTLHRLRRDFYWPHMKQQLKQCIRECNVCQQVKHENVALGGLLQPLPVPDRVWLISPWTLWKVCHFPRVILLSMWL